jgi:hypothetical protein
MVVSFYTRRKILCGTLTFMDALNAFFDARACEAGLNLLDADAVIVFHRLQQ